MIRDYKKEFSIDKISEYCTLYKVSQKGNNYFMYQFLVLNQCDQYNFKIIKKLITCNNVLGLVERFVQNGITYFITQYAQSDLLKQQLQQSHQIFPIPIALQYFSKLIEILEQIHQNNIIFRNIRPEVIKLHKNQLYFADFTLAQVVKRKQRYFEIVGIDKYLAPQFFTQDGYGYEIDIWAAGVCLYFMITGSYPFKMKDKTEQQMSQEIIKKCKKGFSFQTNLSDCKRAKYIESNRVLQDLFKRIFQMDYNERITIQEIKQHPALVQFTNEGRSPLKYPLMMSMIQEKSTQLHESIFASKLKKFPCHYEFHKEQVVLDFLEHSSEVFMLDFAQLIPQKMRSIINFSVLKIAIMKVNSLEDILYGKKQPHFKIDSKQWDEIRKTSAFVKVKQKVQRKKKIIDMLFKASLLNIQNYVQKSSFYSEQIPSDFSTVKYQYRLNLSKMFQIGKQIMKKKDNKKLVRKVCENLTRLTILCMINRIFQEPDIKQNFQLYFKWSKKQSLEDLEAWVQNEKIINLKTFIKFITSKYLE